MLISVSYIMPVAVIWCFNCRITVEKQKPKSWVLVRQAHIQDICTFTWTSDYFCRKYSIISYFFEFFLLSGSAWSTILVYFLLYLWSSWEILPYNNICLCSDLLLLIFSRISKMDLSELLNYFHKTSTSKTIERLFLVI